MEILELKQEMDHKLGELEKKIDKVLDVLTGGLSQDGGVLKKVKDIEDRVQNHENFKNRIIVIWATIVAISVTIGTIAGLAIAYVNNRK